MKVKETFDEEFNATLKKVEIPYKGETAILKMIIDNSLIIQGQEAIMQVKLNKILLASVSHEF